MNRRGIILSIVAAGVLQLRAQEAEYRFSFVDEGTLSRIRIETPLNYRNKILPQSSESNLTAANLFLGYGGLSASLNFGASSDNLRTPGYSYSIRELSLDYSLTDEIDMTFGKKILKWGTGCAFNPTGVVEPQRSPSDLSDRFGRNDGRTLVSATAFVGRRSIMGVYMNDVQLAASKLSWGKQEIALRAYTLMGGMDCSVVGHYTVGDRLETGLNWAKDIGSNLELHGEALAAKGSSAEYHRSITSGYEQQFYSSNPYVVLYRQSDGVFYKILLGGQYTFENGFNIILEYYHNAEGLSKIEWQRWMKFVKFHNSIQQESDKAPPILAEASRNNILWVLRVLSPRGTMSDYIFLREYVSAGRWSVECVQFLNAHDFSAVVIPSILFELSENVSCYSRWTSFIGNSDSEFGSLFNPCSFNIGIRYQL